MSTLPTFREKHSGTHTEEHSSSEVSPTELSAPLTTAADDQIDHGYAWVCAGALSLLNGCTWGVAAVSSVQDEHMPKKADKRVKSYGVYLSHYLDSDYFPNATPLDYAFIGGLEFGVALVISPGVTILTREFGRKLVMISGVLMMSGGYIAASFASQIWQLYLTQGVLVGLGIGFMFIPGIAVLPQWFLKRRSLAGGIASAGSGFAGLAFSLGTDAMIRQISLAWALRITGIICLVGNTVATLLLKDRNHIVKPPQLGFAIHLLKRYDCLLLLSWAFINLLGYMTILYSLSNYAVYIGLNQKQASLLTALLNLGTGIGRPLIGLASDRFGRIEVAATLTFGCAISVFAFWIPDTSYGFLIFFSLVAGAILGTFWMVITHHSWR